MSAQLKLRAEVYPVEPGITVRQAMLDNDLDPESIVPTREGKMIDPDELIREGDTIRLVTPISGGA